MSLKMRRLSAGILLALCPTLGTAVVVPHTSVETSTTTRPGDQVDTQIEGLRERVRGLLSAMQMREKKRRAKLKEMLKQMMESQEQFKDEIEAVQKELDALKDRKK